MNTVHEVFKVDSIVFDGATSDANETTLTITDPTMTTITLPNTSGTVAVSASSGIALSLGI